MVQTGEGPGAASYSRFYLGALVPLCPFVSLTSVAAIHRLVASGSGRPDRLDPAGEFV